MVSKEEILNFIQALINDGILHPDDIGRFVPERRDFFKPEIVRQDLERWFVNLGIEMITEQRFLLSPCPFSEKEIRIAYRNKEIILCVPKGLSRMQLGKLFRISSWAIEDSLVVEPVPNEDFWFKTPITLEPPYVHLSAKEMKRKFEDEDKLGFSLSRYLVFLSRMKCLTGKWPDQKWWTWLLAYKYDRSGFLVAGFDSEGKLSVHGWMPDFKAKFVGARYLMLPEKG